MLSLYLEAIGLLFDFIGALLLLIPLFKSKEEVKKENYTIIDGNPYVIQAWRKERKIGIAGLCCLILGFTLQIVAIFT